MCPLSLCFRLLPDLFGAPAWPLWMIWKHEIMASGNQALKITPLVQPAKSSLLPLHSTLGLPLNLWTVLRGEESRWMLDNLKINNQGLYSFGLPW